MCDENHKQFYWLHPVANVARLGVKSRWGGNTVDETWLNLMTRLESC
ncbi:hypothetical protein [Levilactobacillus cerevisiae]|nr:hypothetical protein [Levilactobacillus cerevisiae]